MAKATPASTFWNKKSLAERRQSASDARYLQIRAGMAANDPLNFSDATLANSRRLTTGINKHVAGLKRKAKKKYAAPKKYKKSTATASKGKTPVHNHKKKTVWKDPNSGPPKVVKNRFGGYEYNPAYEKQSTGGADTVYDKATGGINMGTGQNSQSKYNAQQQNGGTGTSAATKYVYNGKIYEAEQGPPDAQGNAQLKLGKVVGQAAVGAKNGILQDKGGNQPGTEDIDPGASSQATFTKDGKVFHKASGTMINDMQAEQEYVKQKPKIKQYAEGTYKKNGKTYRKFRMTDNPNYVKPGTLKEFSKNSDSNEQAENTIGGKKSKLLWEAENYGNDYVIKKYGKKVFEKNKTAIEFQTTTTGRAGMDASSNGKKVKVRIGNGYQMREIGNSSLNDIRNIQEGPNFNVGTARNAFTEGGEQLPQGIIAPREQQGYNLENESNLPQGQHHEWAQSTSISSLINGQLRQSATSGQNYWDTWAQSKGGSYSSPGRPSSQFGLDPRWSPSDAGASPSQNNMEGSQFSVDDKGNIVMNGASTQAAVSNPMGAFGTSAGMGMEDEAEGGAPANTNSTGNSAAPTNTATMNGATVAPKPSGVYNPWGFGQGSEYNQYGPSQERMAQSTMEAVALANAYFSPQRLELAQQLGDMETDMRRLAVNLGRQVDDPVLQAKMYKEAMTATRAMDVQQNTFAFQMSEQRRREELANFQHYDSMAQQEHQLRQQNTQYYDRLSLDNATFDLNRWSTANHPMYNQAPASAAPTAGAPAATGGAPAAAKTEDTDSYGNITKYKGGY